MAATQISKSDDNLFDLDHTPAQESPRREFHQYRTAAAPHAGLVTQEGKNMNTSTTAPRAGASGTTSLIRRSKNTLTVVMTTVLIVLFSSLMAPGTASAASTCNIQPLTLKVGFPNFSYVAGGQRNGPVRVEQRRTSDNALLRSWSVSQYLPACTSTSYQVDTKLHPFYAPDGSCLTAGTYLVTVETSNLRRTSQRTYLPDCVWLM